MALPDMTADEFLAAATTVHGRMPQARLVKNQVGNLSLLDACDEYVGWVNLRTGEVTFFADEPTDEAS